MDNPKKQKKNRVKKSKEELAVQHRKNIAHSVESIQKWAEKLEKQVSSRKYPVSQADLDKIFQALDESISSVKASAMPKEAGVKPKFSLD